MKQTVYIETSIISYLTARPSIDALIAARQKITDEWWKVVLPCYEAFISPIVLAEVSKGDSNAVQLRLKSISSFAVLEVFSEVHDLADTYFSEIKIPEKARADAYHLALASWHGLDFLISWNCVHIASGRVRMIIEEINSQRGIRTPIICTPEELML